MSYLKPSPLHDTVMYMTVWGSSGAKLVKQKSPARAALTFAPFMASEWSLRFCFVEMGGGCAPVTRIPTRF